MIDTGLIGHSLYSELNGRRFEHWTWVPPDARAPLPVVLLLHGVHDAGGFIWWQRGRAHETASRLVESGAVPPFALLIAGDTGAEHGSAYTDWSDGTTRAETYVVDELLGWARAELGATALHVAGLSMGGYGAMLLALRHPGMFASASAMSGFFAPRSLFTFVPDVGTRIWGGDTAEHDVARLLLDPARRGSTRLGFDCGDADELIGENRRMHAALDAGRIEHDYVEVPGGHDWDVWSSRLGAHLRFHLTGARLGVAVAAA